MKFEWHSMTQIRVYNSNNNFHEHIEFKAKHFISKTASQSNKNRDVKLDFVGTYDSIYGKYTVYKFTYR